MVRINKKTVYKYSFKFTDLSGKDHIHEEKTQHSKRVEDDHEERLLYLAENPKVACLVDVFGQDVVFDDKGGLVGYSVARGLLSVLPPIVVLVILAVVGQLAGS